MRDTARSVVKTTRASCLSAGRQQDPPRHRPQAGRSPLPLPVVAPFAPLGWGAVIGRKDAVIYRAGFADQARALEFGFRHKSDHFTHAGSGIGIGAAGIDGLLLQVDAKAMPNHSVVTRLLRCTHIRSATGTAAKGTGGRRNSAHSGLKRPDETIFSE